eukprot:1568903-Amphidinium_carterae.1
MKAELRPSTELGGLNICGQRLVLHEGELQSIHGYPQWVHLIISEHSWHETHRIGCVISSSP